MYSALLAMAVVIGSASARAQPIAVAPGADAGASLCLPGRMAPSGAAAALDDASADESDDADESEPAIEGASDELQSAKAAEAKALSDEERLVRERVLAAGSLGPANPLVGKLNDLPDALPQIEEDAREARQIAHELEQFETFDVGQAAARYDIPVELNDQVSQYIRMFQGPVRSHFVLWLERSARYIPRMREILEHEGVPDDTVFLSLIESGFNPLAYSVARAAGQWQFIASTGRRFGLRSDFWVDERRDPEKATAAAAGYLKELRGQLGNWYLAWAGYNAGGGTISKAIRRQHSTDFWTLIRGRVLRKETKGYVPKLIAAALISKHPHAFGFDEVQYQQTVGSETVEVPEPTELSFLSTAAGTDVETLRDLNPALRRFCTPPSTDGRPYLIHVPVGTADRVQAALKNRPSTEKLAFRYHRVQPGEGLAAVARQFSVLPEVIARMNGLRQQALRPGRDLVIPIAAGHDSDARVAAVSDEREFYKKRGRGRRSRRSPTGWRASDDCQDPFVKSADAPALVLDPEPPAPPPRVVFKRRAALAEAPAATAARPPWAAGVAQPPPGGTYELRDGDNLWAVAKRLHVPVADLMRWNQLDDDSVLQPGQTLKVSDGQASGVP